MDYGVFLGIMDYWIYTLTIIENNVQIFAIVLY